MRQVRHLASVAGLDLAQHVRPGDGVLLQEGCGESLTLGERLVEQRAGFSGATVFFGAGFTPTFQPSHADHLRFKGTGGMGSLRKLASAGVLDPVPCHLSSIESLLRTGDIRSDVVLLQVSPPNESGEYSFGLTHDYMRAAMERARVVIAEVNDRMPWVPCDRPLADRDFTVTVRSSRDPFEFAAAPFGDLERRIAANLADVIPDRATIQMGIGSVPEAVVSMLADRRGLGIHSGLVGDSLVRLVESGAVTNAHKGVDEGVTIAGVLVGTRRLYRFVDRNVGVRLCPSSYTHGAASLGRLKRLVSVNSALEVDLTGQVNAEAVGSDYIGAVGGQVDYVRAASQSEGGVSIVALPSCRKDGSARIVSRLGGPVTTARSDVDVVATEHGIARLRGKTLGERVQAMVAIAAPEHRDQLLREARGHRT